MAAPPPNSSGRRRAKPASMLPQGRRARDSSSSALPVPFLVLDPLSHLPDVGPGAEGRVGAGYHQHPVVGTLLILVQVPA